MGLDLIILKVKIQDIKSRIIQDIYFTSSNGMHIKLTDEIINKLEHGRGKYKESFDILSIEFVSSVADEHRL